jgi:hypothetical protein
VDWARSAGTTAHHGMGNSSQQADGNPQESPGACIDCKSSTQLRHHVQTRCRAVAAHAQMLGENLQKSTDNTLGSSAAAMSKSKAVIVFASCYCSAVSLTSEGGVQSVVHCHCGQCRRLSGSAFTTWVSLAKSQVQIIGVENLAMFKATSNVTRHFCKNCGSHVCTADGRLPNVLGVPAGIIKSALPLPKAHYFVSHKAVWQEINDALPQFGGESGFEPNAAQPCASSDGFAAS